MILLAAAALMAAAPVDCGRAMTQTDMNLCSLRAYQAADQRLNTAWAEAAKAAKAEGARPYQRLLDAQRKWIAFRDAQCLAENGPREAGGTIWPLLQNGCLTALTEARLAQLRAYGQARR